ncbi:MAG: dihydropteroate synthase [Desulfobacteraceae bacterium]|nr:MAG: dihydropteroate synthase [Desulfobacteraceae bacterium]
MGFTLRWFDYDLDLDLKTHIIGILNVTPDSFSDGGQYFELNRAIEHGIEMAQDGADIIDVGGESARPYSQQISASEEMERVIPVLEALKKEISIPISIDSCKSEVAREALKAGASMINDISALRFDPHMAAIAAEEGVPVILMHMKGTPDNMQKNPTYGDLIPEIISFLKDALDRSVQAGIKKDLLIVDPGIGFGKTFDDNLKIIRELSRFEALERPILLGTSNKAFIGHILGKEAHERVTGTMATIAYGVINGAHMVRVHNVKAAVETVRVIDAIKRGQV